MMIRMIMLDIYRVSIANVDIKNESKRGKTDIYLKQ